MSTNEGKKNQKAPGRPAAARKVKGERQKAKGESVKPKAESAKPKAPAVENEVKSGVNPSAPEIEKSEIENPTSDITTMEVHHHPQLDHSPKPIKEYLLEGFMIFIAVMMGFIAENIREYINNNEQVKHLTAQLVQDLKADTAQLNHIFKEEDTILRYNDTLITLLQQPLATADTRHIQRMAAGSHSMWLFHPSAGAIAAIKNQLHLAQFSNSEIIGLFAQYEKHIELVHIDQDVNLQYQRTYLDPFITAHFTPANLQASFDNHARLTPQMRNLTKGDLDQLATDMVLMRLVTQEMMRDNRIVKGDAVSLLEYVKKQYNPGE